MGFDGDRQRYFFMHIPKTAGMTLYLRLIRCHGDALYPLPFDRGQLAAAMDVEHLEDRFRTFRDQIRVVVGHFPLCVDEVLGAPLRTFTLLRDPVGRTLSLLRQYKEQIESFHDASLGDVYSHPYVFHGLVHNYMVKVLTMTVAEMQAGVVTVVAYDDARLERAKHNLEHRVEIFGLQEDFRGFCDRLASHFGWDLGDAALFTNRTSPADVSDELRERIAHDCALDVQLYGFAKDLLDRRRREAATSPPA